MEIPKLILFVSCIYFSYASHDHHSHTIPVEGYETKLQDLGQHVEIPETPVKVIKITKTIAVKIPVPYPVKVIQKVPYPVHISKPYPVPVPQIVHVPAPTHKYGADDHSTYQGSTHGGNSYQVQERLPHESAHEEHSFVPAQEHTYSGGSSSHNPNIDSFAEEFPPQGSHGGGSSYDVPSQSYYGNTGNGGSNSVESQNYDLAIQGYLQKYNPSSGSGGAGGYYH